MKYAYGFLLSLSLLGFAAPEEPAAPTAEALVRWHVYEIQDALKSTSFPVKAGELLGKLGGKDALVWSSTTSRNRAPSTITFAVAKALANGWPCFVELDVEEVSSELAEMKVLRARICYLSPFGLTFYLDGQAAGLREGPSVSAPSPSP